MHSYSYCSHVLVFVLVLVRVLYELGVALAHCFVARVEDGCARAAVERVERVAVRGGELANEVEVSARDRLMHRAERVAADALLEHRAQVSEHRGERAQEFGQDGRVLGAHHRDVDGVLALSVLLADHRVEARSVDGHEPVDELRTRARRQMQRVVSLAVGHLEAHVDARVHFPRSVQDRLRAALLPARDCHVQRHLALRRARREHLSAHPIVSIRCSLFFTYCMYSKAHILSRLLSHLVAVEVARDAGGGGDVGGGPVGALRVAEHVERGL